MNDQIYLYGLFFLAMIISLISQTWIHSSYAKYKNLSSQLNLTGAQLAKKTLEDNGIFDVEVVEGRGGELSDYYDPKNKIVSLSQNIYHTNSIAAIAVASHEVGHAIQHAQKYPGLAIRNSILPATLIASKLSMFLIMASIFFQLPSLLWLGIILYSVILLFQILTLPIEFDASKRALKNLKEKYLLNESDYTGAKKMLTSAAFTYVAAVLATLMTILRYIIIAQNGNRRR